jgi:eukaryotic-like serine/threonine-protein kinase
MIGGRAEALPERIGPYRVLTLLGTGGMGEVLLAYDERLDRRVAIKRVRTDSDASPERRERFRREAQMAARLNHPAIVQIYDVLAEGNVDYIVMEYVEGTNLRRMLVDGPLDAETVRTLGLDIARGLEEAHRQGIVHRDLKSENVLITASGHAKITDFGIAKRILAEKTDESLTAWGNVLGTYRAMSPEQARGEPVNYRSDLFSFGVLLYEALTGHSPFEADNDLATLNRIVHVRQAPARSVNPAVPAELSQLVDHLLEKDPLLRPRSAGEVALALEGKASGDRSELATVVETLQGRRETAAQRSYAGSGPVVDSALAPAKSRKGVILACVLLLAAGLGAAAYLYWRPPAAPTYVAVLAPEVVQGSGSEATELLASGVRAGLIRTLISLQGISPKSTQEVAATSGSPVQVARAVAADEVIASRLSCRPASCRVTLDRIRSRDGALLWSESFDVPVDDAFLAARAAATQLRRGYADQRVRAGAPEMDVNAGDFEKFLRLRERFFSRRDATLDPLLKELAEVRTGSPRFVDAYLLEAEAARYQFYSTRRPEYLDRAFDLIRQARELAPGDPQPLLTLFAVALDGGRLDTAAGALAELEHLTPGDVAVQERRAQLLNARGQQSEALAVMAAAVQQSPSWPRLYKLASMQREQGRLDDARRSLHQLLSRSPGNLDGLSMLAQIELMHGDPKQAAALYREIVRHRAGPAELSNLGLAYFLLGRYPEAAEAFRRTVEAAPDNPLLALNLADSYLLVGRRAEANSLYLHILELIAADPSTASKPQFLTAKAQALAHLGRGPAAVAAVQEALRLAPNNGVVAYEASLVYAVLGEETSALANAERALRLGQEPGWFSFPWFDSLRTRPEFQALLKQPPPS